MQPWLAARRIWEREWRKETARLRPAATQQVQDAKAQQRREEVARRVATQIKKLNRGIDDVYRQLKHFASIAPAARRKLVATLDHLFHLRRQAERHLQVADAAVAKRLRAAVAAARRVWEKYEPRGLI